MIPGVATPEVEAETGSYVNLGSVGTVLGSSIGGGDLWRDDGEVD